MAYDRANCCCLPWGVGEESSSAVAVQNRFWRRETPVEWAAQNTTSFVTEKKHDFMTHSSLMNYTSRTKVHTIEYIFNHKLELELRTVSPPLCSLADRTKLVLNHSLLAPAIRLSLLLHSRGKIFVFIFIASSPFTSATVRSTL